MIDRVIKMFKQVIYYFIAVVEQGSFSKAAKKFYLSQSAISQQITKLENDLGFSLFDRRTYYPTLTEEGKRYYDLAKKLLSDYKNEYNDNSVKHPFVICFNNNFSTTSCSEMESNSMIMFGLNSESIDKAFF